MTERSLGDSEKSAPKQRQNVYLGIYLLKIVENISGWNT
jgi:hypothetical protein